MPHGPQHNTMLQTTLRAAIVALVAGSMSSVVSAQEKDPKDAKAAAARDAKSVVRPSSQPKRETAQPAKADPNAAKAQPKVNVVHPTGPANPIPGAVSRSTACSPVRSCRSSPSRRIASSASTG